MKTLEMSLNICMEVPEYLVECVHDSKEVEQMVERMSLKKSAGSGATPNNSAKPRPTSS